MTNWWADEVVQVEGDLAVVWPELIVDLRDPSVTYAADYARLLTREGEVLALNGEWSEDPQLVAVRSGEQRTTTIALGPGEDGEWAWFAERGGPYWQVPATPRGTSSLLSLTMVGRTGAVSRILE